MALFASYTKQMPGKITKGDNLIVYFYKWKKKGSVVYFDRNRLSILTGSSTESVGSTSNTISVCKYVNV